MYDLKPLEEEWERYHRKKSLPLYIGIFIGLFFIAAIGIALYNDTFSNIDIENKIAKIENNNTTIRIDTEKVLDNTSKQVVIKEVENPMPKEDIKHNNPIEMIVDDIPILEDKREREKTEVSSKTRKKMHLDIIESSSLDAYKDVEKRFFKSGDVDDSLFLAKAYYDIGKYNKSEFWALQTNKINSTIDESWIIFAQSKVMLGQKNEAISILSNYIKRTGSERAKDSLLKIKTSK
ncbi:MAG TPA: hypothetical protein EYG73_03020 [Arcobacter sp.]|nr:hypothetical protein [Arcobacter sp.]